ncbi:hypothetical protein BDF14DRAFT_813689 [Spinellus fusiger]|nr:hypothetical protein BDF14DRAFT_813689 [Spinellus fusiger]
MFTQKLFNNEKGVKQPFCAVKRVDLSDYTDIQALYNDIQKHCVNDGLPLVIANVNTHSEWDNEFLSLENLVKIKGDSVLDLYNMKTRSVDKKHSLGTYVTALKKSRSEENKDSISKDPSSIHSQQTQTKINRELFDASVSNNHEESTYTKAVDTIIESIITPATTPLESSSVIRSTIEKRLSETVSMDIFSTSSSSTHESDNEHTTKHSISSTESVSTTMSMSTTIKTSTTPTTTTTTQTNSLKQRKKATLSNLYGKDISCPDGYDEILKKLLPDFLLSLGNHDLFACLPEYLRAENLMCYLGSTGTGTALHRDLCATFGHNLMTYGDPGAYSEWLVIEDCYRNDLIRVLHAPKPKHSKYNEEDTMEDHTSSFIESDQAWIKPKILRAANIKTHVIVQRPGDLVLIPSLCYHQVRNRGISMKIAWNRVTPYSLEKALRHQVPIYQSIARPETYKCKSIVHCTLEGSDIFLDECRIMLNLYREIVVPELIEDIPSEEVYDKGVKAISEVEPHTLTCDFCRCDIFMRYYHCEKCYNNDNKLEGYDMCLHCYSQGRCCQHMDSMTMHQAGGQ